MSDDGQVRVIELVQTREIAYPREVVTEYHYPVSNGDLARLKFTHTRRDIETLRRGLKDRKRNFIPQRD